MNFIYSYLSNNVNQVKICVYLSCGWNHYLFTPVSTGTFFFFIILFFLIYNVYNLNHLVTNTLLGSSRGGFLLEFPSRINLSCRAELDHLSSPHTCYISSVFVSSKPKYFRSDNKTWLFLVLLNYCYCGLLWNCSL